MTTFSEASSGRNKVPGPHAIREDVQRMMVRRGELVPLDLVGGAQPPRGSAIYYRTRCACGWVGDWECADDARYHGHMHVRGIVLDDVAQAGVA